MRISDWSSDVCSSDFGLHFNREPRFYADMAFDGSKWFMQTGTYNIQSKSEQHTGKKQSRLYSITGYYTKKLVNWNLVATQTSVNIEAYPWPIIRLGELGRASCRERGCQ